MKKPLRVLMVEDSEDDALLLIRVLKNGGYDPEYKRVQSAETMRAALREKSWDVILCDYRLPQFNGLAAIALLKESGIDIPLIVVSGAIGEETAADCMRCGAHDYVMKGNLSRLVPAIARELMEADSKNKRRQAEKAFQEGEERFRRISSMISDIAYSCIMEENGHFSINWMTGAAERISGYSIAEIKAQRCWRFLVFEEDQTLFEENVTGLTPGSHGLCELRIRHKNGGIIWIASYAECVMGTETPERFVLYGGLVDITERKQAQEELLISEELFRSYLENAPDGVYLSDVKGNFLYGNRKCEEIIGYRREELIGKNFLELNLLSENSLNKAAQLLQANIEGKSTGPDEIELISKEGHRIPVEINTSVVQRMGQGIVLAFVRDITERKQAEGWLLRERSMVDRIMKTSPAGISVVNRDGRIIFANKRAQEILGLSVDEITGLTYDSLEWRITDFDGNPFPIENLPFARVISSGNPAYGIRHAINSPDGRRVYLSINGAPIVDEKGSINEVVFTIDDVTEQRRSEEKISQTIEKLWRSINDTIRSMAMMVETRDPYTAGHQERVANLAAAIAQDLNLPQEQINGIRMAGVIHDIGKMNIPAEILSKPTKLSHIEFELIKSHAKIGYDILKTIELPYSVANITYQHHERIDGSGYPQKLKGDEILLDARILAVADVVEAMASHRPYRPAIGIDAALKEIEKNRGVLYDDTVADVCLKLFREKGYRIEGT